MSSTVLPQEFRRILADFKRAFYYKFPYSKYICDCTPSVLFMHDGFEHVSNRKEFCISVSLNYRLPPALFLPSEYGGVRVFSGIIRAS